jgi:uncharacterized protein YeeX (DUF496 family)
MKTVVTLPEINKRISKCNQRINALQAAISRLSPDRDYVQERKVLEIMKQEYTKELDNYNACIKSIEIEIDV